MLMPYALCSSAIPHSVTQGDFSKPCAYLAAGFDSGLLSGRQFSLNITNDKERTQTYCHFLSLCSVTTTRDSHLFLLQD